MCVVPVICYTYEVLETRHAAYVKIGRMCFLKVCICIISNLRKCVMPVSMCMDLRKPSAVRDWSVSGSENTCFFVLLPASHIILPLMVSFHQNSESEFSKYFSLHSSILQSFSQNAHFLMKFYTFNSLASHLTMKELTPDPFLFLNSILEKTLIL